jgi:hypothetical protein
MMSRCVLLVKLWVELRLGKSLPIWGSCEVEALIFLHSQKFVFGFCKPLSSKRYLTAQLYECVCVYVYVYVCVCKQALCARVLSS